MPPECFRKKVMCQNTNKTHRKTIILLMCNGIGQSKARQKTLQNTTPFPQENGPGSLLKTMPKSRYEQRRTNFANCYFFAQSWHRARGGINIKIVLFSFLGPRLAQGGPEETPKRNKVSEMCKSDVAKLAQGSKMTTKTTTLARSASRSELWSLHSPRHLLLLASRWQGLAGWCCCTNRIPPPRPQPPPLTFSKVRPAGLKCRSGCPHSWQEAAL